VAETAELGLDVLDGEYLSILANLSVELKLCGLQAQIKPVLLVIERNEEEHSSLEFLLDFEVVTDLLPVFVDVDAEVLLGEEIDFVAPVLVAEAVSVAHQQRRFVQVLYQIGQLLRHHKRHRSAADSLDGLTF